MKMFFVLLLFISTIFGTSCSVLSTQSPRYRDALGKSKPRFEGIPVHDSIPYYNFTVYRNGVYLQVKSGHIKPQHIYVYNLGGEAYDTVFARTSGTWSSYTYLPPNAPFSIDPNTMDEEAAKAFIKLAYAAKEKASRQSVSPHQSTQKPVPTRSARPSSTTRTQGSDHHAIKPAPASQGSRPLQRPNLPPAKTGTKVPAPQTSRPPVPKFDPSRWWE